MKAIFIVCSLVLLVEICTAKEDFRTCPSLCLSNERYDKGLNPTCGCFKEGGVCKTSNLWCRPHCICKENMCLNDKGKCIPIIKVRKVHCPCEK